MYIKGIAFLTRATGRRRTFPGGGTIIEIYRKGHNENKQKLSEGHGDPRRRHAERRDVSGCKAGDSFCCADYSLRRGRRRIQVNGTFDYK